MSTTNVINCNTIVSTVVIVSSRLLVQCSRLTPDYKSKLSN